MKKVVTLPLAGAAMALLMLAAPAQATPASQALGKPLVASGELAKNVDVVYHRRWHRRHWRHHHRRCWWHHGHRHCRWW